MEISSFSRKPVSHTNGHGNVASHTLFHCTLLFVNTAEDDDEEEEDFDDVEEGFDPKCMRIDKLFRRLVGSHVLHRISGGAVSQTRQAIQVQAVADVCTLE